ncbi:MAG: hypothetical protein J6R18_02255 [Kiritimatiellae bacterium]|nr:hypothetical protein [Kiritimatiellia bacterium]
MKLLTVLSALAAIAADAAVVKGYCRIDGNESAALPGKVIYADMLANGKLWRNRVVDSNYNNKLRISREGGTLSVYGTESKKTSDTAWSVKTKPLPLAAKGLGYAFAFEIESNMDLRATGGSDNYSSFVEWYDHAGKVIMKDPFPLRAVKVGKGRQVFVGSVPLAAESFAVQFGFDRPNIIGNEHLKLSSLEFSVMPAETDAEWMHIPEPEAPRIKVASETPFTDRLAELKISIESKRAIDVKTLKISVDGKDETPRFVQDGSIFTFKPSKKWTDGLHKAIVTLTDPESGASIKAEKIFYFGYVDKSYSGVKLRDDGMVLVKGKPFFPIGLYGLRALPANGYNMEKAVKDVAEAGFNLIHSYQVGTTREFLDLAQKYGVKTWTESRIPGTNFVETLRKHPAVLAWYVGDDTSMHYSAQQIYDRVDGVNAIDPRRITCQADVMNGGDAVSSYRPYVKVTDVFMPEIYPVHELKPDPLDKCVALTVRDMKRFKSDVAEAKDDKPHAVWPIIQYFKGWKAWQRFPNRDELYAMTFASIAHGAHGVTWYTYGGVVDPARKIDNHGVSATPETWRNITNLVSRIRELSPVLVTRTPIQPEPATILSGPEKDVLGNESISMLLKRYRGDTYVIAVNGTVEEVKARFDIGGRTGKANVLWENRTVKMQDGKITDVFGPFAVHVYKIDDPVNYIAHQGEEGLAPNHSKAAYRISAENKLDYLKLDLQETKDGHVVLQHDSTLKAIMKWDVKISDCTLAEIRERGRCIPRGGYTNETIVTLQEALEISKGMRKGIWLDFKYYSSRFAEKVFRIVDEAGIPMDRVIVATFTKDALRWVQKNRPEVRRVAHTFILKVDGGFQMNAGEENKIYPTTQAVVEGLVAHAKKLGLYGFNLPHIYRRKRQLYHTIPHIVKDLQKAGYWISIWFAYDSGTAEYYREVGADTFVTNWKARTFPEFSQKTERWAHLMRLMATVPEKITDAGSKRRNEALYFCTWEPQLAAETIVASGVWPATATEIIDVLEKASWQFPKPYPPKVRKPQSGSNAKTKKSIAEPSFSLKSDYVKNGSFEVRGEENAWKLSEGWKITRGVGRNGGGGLVFETSEKIKKGVFAEQIVDVVPNKVYDFSAWVDAKLDSAKGIYAIAHFLDGNEKMIGFCRTISHGAKRPWGRIWGRSIRLPPQTKKIRLRLCVPSDSIGRVCFDDVTFSPYKVEPVTAVCSSCYRNEAVAGEAPFKLFAGIDLNDVRCTTNDASVYFSFETAEGKKERRKASEFNSSQASVEVDPKELKIGVQNIAVEVVDKDGEVLGGRVLQFTRLERRPERPVYIDRDRRVIVDGKPFFPIAVYCTRAESNIVEHVGKSPFNAIMAYHKVDWAMLDWFKANGLMASTHCGDMTETENSIRRRVSRLSDHPAMLAWLMNDERPLSMIDRVVARNKMIIEADKGRHPTWAVLYQVDDMRGYVGSCDAIGSDPYPICHTTTKLAYDWAEKTRMATFGAMSLWQTTQIFDWAAYKTKGVKGTDVSKYRAPTLAEMKIMTWMQIACGANAIFMYSYNPLQKMDWRDPFEKKWAEVCECANEIAAVTDILLSVEKAPEVKELPAGIAARTWSRNGKVYLLLCNATAKSKTASLSLPDGFGGEMTAMFGGGVSKKGNTLTIDFSPDGYAFLSF